MTKQKKTEERYMPVMWITTYDCAQQMVTHLEALVQTLELQAQHPREERITSNFGQEYLTTYEKVLAGPMSEERAINHSTLVDLLEQGKNIDLINIDSLRTYQRAIRTIVSNATTQPDTPSTYLTLKKLAVALHHQAYIMEVFSGNKDLPDATTNYKSKVIEEMLGYVNSGKTIEENAITCKIVTKLVEKAANTNWHDYAQLYSLRDEVSKTFLTAYHQNNNTSKEESI